MYSEKPLCDHDGDGSRQHIATIYDHEEAAEMLRLWNLVDNNNNMRKETHAQLKSRLHKAIFGDTFGYDLELAATITPGVLTTARRLRLLTALRRLRRASANNNNNRRTK